VRRLAAALAAAGLLWLSAAPAFAVLPDEVLSDSALEARARRISEGLRCLVCQNQSIDDSEAPLARDLRLLVRERLKLGDNDQAVQDFLVARYGEFILLRPPLAWHTAALWMLPFAALGIGALFVLAKVRGSGAPARAAALSADERADLDRLLGRD